jgi:DNA-binding cell septation regulator SpoVG
MEGKDGALFVSMPSMKTGGKDPDGNAGYKEICNPITKEFREQMNQAILASYEKGESISFDDKKDGSISVSTSVYDRAFGKKVGDARIFINDSFVVSNISVFETTNGNLYPAMPSYKTNKKDDKGKVVYQEMCSPSKNLSTLLNKAIIDQFKERRADREANKISIKDRMVDAKEKIGKQSITEPIGKGKEFKIK